MAWRKSDKLMDMVAHYANFVSHRPANGLRMS
jgi:hypothetical protein